MGRTVVLLGPPGSGKSTIGVELARLGLRWRDWESWILESWGTRERFVANKAEALASLHEAILHFIDGAETPAVIESTGLSDHDFLDRLCQDYPGTFIVRLDVSEAEALKRVAARVQGRHLSDAIEGNRAVWQAFQVVVVPSRAVGLVIDTELLAQSLAAAEILRALEATPQRSE
ncbi:MAG: AAA family ATPase [Dehalococcoidia bacterium]